MLQQTPRRLALRRPLTCVAQRPRTVRALFTPPYSFAHAVVAYRRHYALFCGQTMLPTYMPDINGLSPPVATLSSSTPRTMPSAQRHACRPFNAHCPVQPTPPQCQRTFNAHPSPNAHVTAHLPPTPVTTSSPRRHVVTTPVVTPARLSSTRCLPRAAETHAQLSAI
ncbi:hypothetical protein NPIL_468111 [Nephila pilipes]|uniref:Uncharacterized protein n=1 Tax=Nephila pilipes TaxID=299642 RepID=A0A8X6TNF6_NEPPI|nr:hypothetical protein NPIL_468111 [Nephila pilipes]